jgi:hypothetical protein
MIKLHSERWLEYEVIVINQRDFFFPNENKLLIHMLPLLLISLKKIRLQTRYDSKRKHGLNWIYS